MEGLNMRKSEIKKYALNYIKAITARGGNGYEEWEEYDNDFCEWCFDKWIEEQPRVTCTLYRGYRMSLEQYGNLSYKVGSVVQPINIYNRPYPSFTTSEMRAMLYVNDYDVYSDDIVSIVYKIECKGKYGVDIQNYSYYPEEAEHKFISDAKFKITDIKEGTIIRISLVEV